MRVKYEFHLHVYSDLEHKIHDAIKQHNEAYTLKITDYKKYASRWYFTVDAEFPKDLDKKGIEMMKYDTIFRLGYFIK